MLRNSEHIFPNSLVVHISHKLLLNCLQQYAILLSFSEFGDFKGLPGSNEGEEGHCMDFL